MIELNVTETVPKVIVMWKTIAFYGLTAAVFGALAFGSAQYTSQFSVDNSAVASSYTKQKGSGKFGSSNSWIKR